MWLVLICLLLILGFMLAWVINVVAREDIPVMTGFWIVLLWGIVIIVVQSVMREMTPALAPYLGPILPCALLALLIKAGAKVSWKHSWIVAISYSLILMGVGFLFSL